MSIAQTHMVQTIDGREWAKGERCGDHPAYIQRNDSSTTWDEAHDQGTLCIKRVMDGQDRRSCQWHTAQGTAIQDDQSPDQPNRSK